MPEWTPPEDYHRSVSTPTPRSPVDAYVPSPMPSPSMLTGDDGSIQTPEAAQRFADWRERQQPQPSKFMGSLPHSRFTPSELAPLGTQGATTQFPSAAGRLRGLVGPTNYPQSGVGLPPTDVAPPPQPTAAQSPTGWFEQLQSMLQNANVGLDPARTGLQSMFGQQQQQQQPTFRDVSHRPQPGGRPVRKFGPQTLPVSTRTQPISRSNRIAGNIAAVLSGRQGPSPGTSPTGQAPRPPRSPEAQYWRYGPTGELAPRRNPVRKPMSPFYQPGE